MRTLVISPADNRPGVILSGQGADLWFLTSSDAKAYAEHILRIDGGRTELRDGYGNLTDWFDVRAAGDDGIRLLI